jgi:hypothetical protein
LPGSRDQVTPDSVTVLACSGRSIGAPPRVTLEILTSPERLITVTSNSTGSGRRKKTAAAMRATAAIAAPSHGHREGG